MARSVNFSSGSIFNGNPITFSIQPNVINGTPSFHRVIIEVNCGMSGSNYETIKMSEPVKEEKDSSVVNLDISSALRSFRDSYEYKADTARYPLVKFYLKVYDEYMLNGVVKTMGEIIYPAKTDSTSEQPVFCTIFGAYSDLDRIMSNGYKSTTLLSRKPTDVPHLAFVGESFAYTPPYDTAQNLLTSASLTQPESKAVTITKEGQQTIGGQSIYALLASEGKTRQVFRFINSFGVLESVSVPRVHSNKLSVKSSSYVVARQETFKTFSRSVVRKINDNESWLFQSDPLNKAWLRWYLHEFLMSKHIWMDIEGRFIPCTITPEDDTTFFNRTEKNPLTVSFTAVLGINGSPLL